MMCSAFLKTKKRDCTAAVPLTEALVLPVNPNKQHESTLNMYDESLMAKCQQVSSYIHTYK